MNVFSWMFDQKQQNYHKTIPRSLCDTSTGVTGPTFLSFFTLLWTFSKFTNYDQMIPTKKKWIACFMYKSKHRQVNGKSQILSSLKLLRLDDMSRCMQMKHRDKINWVLEKKTKRKDLTKTLKSHNKTFC